MIDEIRKLRELTETINKHGYLRDRTDEWEYVLDALPEYIYIVDNNYLIKFINKSLKQKLNLSKKSDVYGKVCYEVFEGIPNPLENPPKTTEPTRINDTFIDRLDGWYVINKSPIITDTNKLLGFIVILKDVTAQRVAEMDSQSRQQMLETIYKASPIGIGVVEKDTRIIKFVNHSVCNMLGYKEKDLVNTSARVIYPTEAEFLRVGIEKHGNISEKRVNSLETRWKRADGAIIDVFLSASKVPGGTDIVFTAMDITEVKRNERNLKRNEERLEALLELSKISYLDEEAITAYALEEAVRLTDSKIGYLHFVNNCDFDSDECEINLNLFLWSENTRRVCEAKKARHYPLTSAGIWADSVRLRKPVIHNDYPNESGKKGLPEGHVELKRHMCVPVFDRQKVVAVAGVGNKEHNYDQTDVYQLSVFMNSMWGILSRKRAEKDADDSKRSIENLITSSPMGVLVYSLVDHELILKTCNRSAEKILDLESSEHINKSIGEVFVGLKDSDIAEEFKRVAIAGGVLKIPAYKYKDPVLNIDGVFSVFAYQSREGEVAVFFADVKEQLEAEELIRKSEDKFRAAFMTVPDPALILEAGSGIVIAANPAAINSSGFTEEELLGMSIVDLELWLSIEDREGFYELLYKYGEVNDFPIKVKTKLGKVKEGVFSSRLFDLDGKPHVISIIKDISTVINMRKELCDNEFFYKSIMDRIYEGVFLIQDEKFVLINKPLCNMLGYKENELIDENFLVMVAPRERKRVLETYKARVSGRYDLDKYETMLISKEGEEFHVLIDANVVNYGGRNGSMGTITRIE